MDAKQNILMEAGTNELEILVFNVEEEKYGINVAKVREVVRPPKINHPPNRHPYVHGVFTLREKVIPVINVAKWLGLPDRDMQDKDRVIVTEFNNVWLGFWVNQVDMIYRVSWENISPPPEETSRAGYLTGVAQINDEIVMMLDFEKVVQVIMPDKMTPAAGESSIHLDRSKYNLLIVEDSSVMRNLLVETLTKAGYQSPQCYNNGAEAWQAIQDLLNQCQPGKPISNDLSLVITDIEMPQMDGFHLIKLIKSHDQLQEIPVLIFSSIISHENRVKGESVGVDGQVTKPEIDNLVDLVDQHCAKLALH